MHSERDRELEEPEKKETLEWEGGISIDVQQWYELRCEGDNVGVFSAIFYKVRYSFLLSTAGHILVYVSKIASRIF